MQTLITEENAASSLGMTLGDFLAFINWMSKTEKALDRAESLPAVPSLNSAKIRGWIQLIQDLEQRFRQAEEQKLTLEAKILSQEAKLVRSLSHLYVNMASLYESLGQSQKASEVRRLAEAFHICR